MDILDEWIENSIKLKNVWKKEKENTVYIPVMCRGKKYNSKENEYKSVNIVSIGKFEIIPANKQTHDNNSNEELFRKKERHLKFKKLLNTPPRFSRFYLFSKKEYTISNLENEIQIGSIISFSEVAFLFKDIHQVSDSIQAKKTE